MIDALAIGLILLRFKMLYLNNQPMAHMNMSTFLVILMVIFYLRLFANVLQYHANYKHGSCNRSSLHLMTVQLRWRSNDYGRPTI